MFGQPAQSTSLYAWSWSEEPLGKNKPQVEVPRRYLIGVLLKAGNVERIA